MTKKLYLIDSNILITAKNKYYQFVRVPEFWEWLNKLIDQGDIKIPIEILKELTDGKDELKDWITKKRQTVLLDEPIVSVDAILEKGYEISMQSITDSEFETLSRDVFLIEYAYHDINNRVIVSNEISKPSKTGINSKIPDVCDRLRIKCIDIYGLIEILDFRTTEY